MNWLFEPLPVEVDIVIYFSLLITIIICLLKLRKELLGEENERN